MKKLDVFLVGVTVFWAINAFAYEPTMGHKPIITTALKVYNQCFPDQSLYTTEMAQERVIQGDVAMDEGLELDLGDSYGLKGEGVFSKLIRPFNWHFYNPYRAEYSKVGLIEQSHINLWDDLIKGFKKNKTENNKLLFVGGLIHMVEDLTVPAHVVPVYHGPTAIKLIGPKSLEPLVSYMQDKSSEYSKSIHDAIDTMPPDITRLESELLNNQDICTAVEQESSSLGDIRAVTTQFTLDQILVGIPDCPELVWQDFWLQPVGEEYFGRYNIAFDNPLFGEAGVLTSSNATTCAFEAMESRYLDFVYYQHVEAIKADMKVLYWGSQNISD